ncbi:hypothetical protein IM660_04785 [Ruania alkalisoli]|uniref:Carbohydrate-binding domain-containing protein n=1 Tax=Ruania alkalisoli TaxID=2779775 RepID=A0A7M1SVN5_9MICO|nr:hypothetical protein [Ruania alkalisoli]QOR71608.1 hypothetical protein IM660_04785 [Ruania alkalisoli]
MAPTAQAIAPDATATFTASPELTGVDRVRPGDRETDPAAVTTTVDGVQCWQMQNDPYVRYAYVDVADEVIPEDATRAVITVDYYDVGTGGFDIHYDSTSNPWTGSRNQQLTDTHTWRTTSFELNNINFANRSNGYDFRLNVKAAQGNMPPVCFSGVQISFTDAPLAALQSLAIMSPSTIFGTGEAAIEVATPAEEVTWQLNDSQGVALETGTTAVTSGDASIDLNHLGVGYYTIDVTATINGEPVTRHASLAVLEAPPEGWDGDEATFGAQFHRGWQPDAETEALIDAMELAGYGISRQATTWGAIERELGVYGFEEEGVRVTTELNSRGIDTMWNAGLKNSLYDDGRTPASDEAIAAFAAYAGATAEYYSSNGITHDVGILNEYNSSGFNNGSCGLTPACYLEILEPTSAAIHGADPEANVIAPVTAGVQLAWAEDFIAQGGLDLIDTYGVNYYGYAENGPGTPPEEGTDLMDNLPQLVQMVRAEAPDMPIRVTENGHPTHTAGSTQAQQADQAIRALVLAQAAGVDEHIWYDLYDDGFDPGERENNFGLINRADATSCYKWICPSVEGYEYGAVHGITPKPGFVSHATLIRQTLGLEQGDRDNLGSDSAYSFPYTDGEHTNRVMWSTGSDYVTVTSADGFTLTDQFGQEQQIGAGDYTLELTGSPVFVGGEVQIASASAPVQVEVPEQVVQGNEVPVTVSFGRPGPLPPTVLVGVGDVEQEARVRPGGQATVMLPATELLGEREITVDIASAQDRGRPWTQHAGTRVRAMTEVIEPFEVSVRPRIASTDGGFEYALEVSIANNSTTAALPIEEIDWSVGGAVGLETDVTDVPAGESGTVLIPVADARLFTNQSYDVTVTASGQVKTDEGAVSFSPIEPADAPTLDPIDLNDIGQWRSIRGGVREGAADLGGDLRFTSTADALVMHARISDDVHLADRADPALSWQVDSIQFNTYDLFPTVLGGERVEIAASLYDDGPIVYTFSPPAGQSAGLTPGAEADIVRDETAGTTTYDLTIPWASLGYDGPPAGVWGLSFLVNDADGDVVGADARSGYIEWGSGVGGAPKDPSKFRTVQIVGLDGSA